jgi:hypothetical protein
MAGTELADRLTTFITEAPTAKQAAIPTPDKVRLSPPATTLVPTPMPLTPGSLPRPRPPPLPKKKE